MTQASPPTPWRALVVLAALGDDRRRWQVARQTVERHFDDERHFDCMLLAYSARAVASNGTHERFLRRRCAVAVRERAFWGSLLNLTTPAVVAPFDHVLVLLDDVELSPAFDATAFVDEARRYRLARASPSVASSWRTRPAWAPRRLLRSCSTRSLRASRSSGTGWARTRT